MPTEIKITTLCENNTPYPANGVLGEHGLAMLLEVDSQRILFDTGGGATLLHNSRILGVDLKTIDALVLSHGHYDHTGGLETLLKEYAGPLNIYAHPDIFIAKYHLLEGNEQKYIGIPRTRKELENLGARFHLSREPRALAEGLLLMGEIPRGEKEEDQPIKTLCRQNPDGTLVPDPFYDDQAILVESPLGVIVLLGCTHSGLINTLRYATKLTGKEQIYALIGGTHLVAASEGRLDYTLRELEKFDLQVVAPCHCTGFYAAAAFYQAFKDRFVYNSAGQTFSFGGEI
ncbi:MAG TPA: MBL fold metallo-hydrolase [Firmicutes bacterium]|nr:MBL fold metallo-hydrolase [Bacillota bacterium]